MAGGVSANEQIRAAFEKKAKETGTALYFPEPKYCTDNAVMIASCAYYEFRKGRRAGLDLNAQPVMEL